MNTPTLKSHYTDRRWFIRLLEIFPGFVTWLFLLAPIYLSLLEPIVLAYLIIGFDLLWLLKSLRLSYYLVRGYRRLRVSLRVNWRSRLEDLNDIPDAIERTRAELAACLTDKHKRECASHLAYLEDLEGAAEHKAAVLKPRDIYHAVILATYNESIETLEPSIEALVNVDYPLDRIIFLIAYEERGGQQTARNAKQLIERYGERFKFAAAIKHPDGIAGEVKGKGGNITFAGRELTKYVTQQQIDPEHVVVTTFDSDHRPDRQYFSYLTYVYAANPNRVRRSFQPIPMFYNNIWDAPAPMRVIATGNSFWMLMEAVRPHRLRNFAAHAQSLRTLIDTDYWSVNTIVEDGHQYWRTYFTYDGDHQVVPLYVPVYQDAVLAKGYWRTFKVQFLQLRRWAWGVTDFSYVVRHAIRNHRIPISNRLVHVWRLFEGHFSWATAPLILTFAAWLPLVLNRQFSEQVLAHQLPVIASRILSLTLIGMLVTVYISLISLPPRPARYRRTRFLNMMLQWALLPLTAIVFASFAAINAQTRLMFARYLEFYVTEKATKK